MRQEITKNIPYRNELKYICSEAQLGLLANRMEAICRRDKYVDEDGKYSIRSVYFDDYGNTGYYDNENGTDPRKKYRIRIYNHSPELIHLERKEKTRGKTRKESCTLTCSQCRDLLSGGFIWAGLHELPKLLQEFYYEYKVKLMRPKIIVEYDRTPFVYPDGNVRVTFDRNISSSQDIGHFLDKEIAKRPIMPGYKHILEVKYDELIPDFLNRTLQIRDLSLTAYSKYYLCRKYQ